MEGYIRKRIREYEGRLAEKKVYLFPFGGQGERIYNILSSEESNYLKLKEIVCVDNYREGCISSKEMRDDIRKENENSLIVFSALKEKYFRELLEEILSTGISATKIFIVLKKCFMVHLLLMQL